MPRTRHATDPPGQAGVTRSHQRAKSSTTLESRLEKPSTTLGDSATRPRSRKGKRRSVERSRESPSDWLFESGRVDHNNKTLTNHKHIIHEVNPTQGRTRSGTRSNLNQKTHEKSHNKHDITLLACCNCLRIQNMPIRQTCY